MKPEAAKRTIFADDVGIHLRAVDVVVDWGEIESVDAARWESADGSSSLEVYVNHISGVDFRFDDVEVGYEQVMASMERHLIGFSRAEAESAGTWEQKLNMPVIWKRDESIQPFQLRPLVIDAREPTAAERVQMEAAHRASIATCERILGRPLSSNELGCVHTGFENGRIVGRIAHPLRDLLVKQQGGE